jgi:hypothetical protein
VLNYLFFRKLIETFFLNKLFGIAEAANNQAIMNYIAERLDQHAKNRWKLRTSLNAYQG